MPTIPTNWKEIDAAQSAPQGSQSPQKLSASTPSVPALGSPAPGMQKESATLLSTRRPIKPGVRRPPAQVHALLTKQSLPQSVPDRTPTQEPSEDTSEDTSTNASFKDNLEAKLQARSLSPRAATCRLPIQRSATEAIDPVVVSQPVGRFAEIQASATSRILARSVTALESAPSSIASTSATTSTLNLSVLTPPTPTSRPPRSPRPTAVIAGGSPAAPIASPPQSPRNTLEAPPKVAVAETPSTPVASPLASPHISPAAGKGPRLLPATPSVPKTPAANVGYSLGANAKLELLESKGYSSLQAGNALLKLTRTLELLFPGTDMVSDQMLEQAIGEINFSMQEKLMMVEVGVKCMETPDILGTEEGSYKLQNIAIRAAKFLCAKLGACLNG